MMKYIFLFMLLPLGQSLAASFRPAPHPFSVSWATLFARSDRIDLQLSILAEDLFLFQNIQPGDGDVFSKSILAQAANDHQEFLLRYFFLEDEQGRRLSGKIIEVKDQGIPEGGIHRDNLMEFSLMYLFEFDMPSPVTAVQVHQQFGGEQSPVPAIMMATAYQAGAEGSLTAEISPERPWLLFFDWEQPQNFCRDKSFSRFRNKKEFPVSSILIGDEGVHQELEIPLEMLETHISVPRAKVNELSSEERQQAREEVSAFFTQNILVEIDGRRVAPQLVRFDWKVEGEIAETGTAGLPVAGTTAFLAIHYPSGQPPASVSVTWDSFNWEKRNWRTKITAYEEALSFNFSRYQPEFKWWRY
jgi:hypothetical protein